MRVRRFLVVLLPFALLLGACSDPSGPRLPDDDKDGDDPPPTTEVIGLEG